jgi:thiol-disulfide isomerase/thioredoxin
MQKPIHMKLNCLFFVLILFALSCEKEKTVPEPTILGDFVFASNELTAGDPFRIRYTGEGNLDTGFFHQVVHDKAYPADVTFIEGEAVVSVPDSISAVSFYFTIDDMFDNNKGTGYVFNVVSANGEKQIDSEAAHQFYLINDGSFYDLSTGDPSLALNAISTTLTKHPELKETWMTSHVYTAQQVGGAEAKSIAEQYLSEITAKSELRLKDYEELSSIYARMRDTKRNDSILELVSQSYPNSKLAIQKLTSDFFDLKTLEDKEALYKANQDRILASDNAKYFLQSLARDYFRKDDINTFKSYLEQIPSKTDRASVINSLAWPKAQNGEDLDNVLELSKQSLDYVTEEMKSLKDQPEYYSPNQYQQSLERSYNMYADTYAVLLFKKGRVKEAIAYQEKAVDKGYSPDNNERFVQYLVADKQYEKAAEVSKTFISSGSSTETLKHYFKEAFEKVNPNTDVTAVMEELEAAAKTKQREALEKTKLDERAPDFTAKNLDGETITLSSLKGKTVILDFWATWCGPCIASFPGMQKAVTKHKDNENVVFLFIDTFESGENRITEVQEFITENNYDFHVLIDPKEENGSNHEIAKKYNISGIPTKVIIGPEGRMNFKDVGYSGSNDKLVNKIDLMIELLNPAP